MWDERFTLNFCDKIKAIIPQNRKYKIELGKKTDFFGDILI